MIQRIALGVFIALTVLLPGSVAEARNAVTPKVPSAQEAPIAVLVDITSGQVLYSRNPDRRFIPASMTKVMTIFLAFELIEEGQLDPGQVYTIQNETWKEWAGKGSTMFLPGDARVSVDDLITGIANISANDGAIALAEGQAGSVEAWVSAMNRKARTLGMTNSHFGTPNGWPDAGGTFTSARDLVRLGKAMVERHPKKFARYVGRHEFTYNNITQRNHDPLLGRVAGADGIKTGFTNEAGFGYLGTARRNGQRLMMVVAGVESERLRTHLARQFIEWGFQHFERKRVFKNGAEVGIARVQGGSARQVGLMTERDVFVNVPKGNSGKPALTISYDGPIRAPIAAGEAVARLEIAVPGMEPAIAPLVAREDIAQAGFFQRIWNGIAGWFS